MAVSNERTSKDNAKWVFICLNENCQMIVRSKRFFDSPAESFEFEAKLNEN